MLKQKDVLGALLNKKPFQASNIPALLANCRIKLNKRSVCNCYIRGREPSLPCLLIGGYKNENY